MNIKFFACSVLFLIGSSAYAKQDLEQDSKIDRGIVQHTFIKQGEWFVGGTVSYSSLNSSDYKFLMFDNFDSNRYSVSSRVLGGYFFKDDIAAGLGFEYSRSSFDLPSLGVNLGDAVTIDIEDYTNIEQMFTGIAFLRTYLNLRSSNRFALFNDVKLSIGGGRSRSTSGLGEQMTGTFQKNFRMGLLLEPGMTAFITNNVAAEASVGLLGIRYSHTKQITNQVHEGSLSYFDTRFRINILSINLGISFFF